MCRDRRNLFGTVKIPGKICGLLISCGTGITLTIHVHASVHFWRSLQGLLCMHIVTVSCVTWVEAMKLKAYTQRILIRKDEYSSIMIGNGFSVMLPLFKHDNNTVLPLT